MNEELKTIVAEQIIDNQQADFVPASPRTLEIRALDGVISIVMGVRRCGKSTLMESIMARLVTKGVPRENIVWLNFSDDRFLPLRLGDWDIIHSVYFSIYPEKRRKEKVYFFFDEIQLYPNWELFVERLRREENCEIYITGSSARMLSKEIGTALRGRTLSWELFPFSFSEYLIRCNPPRNKKSSSYRLFMQNAWERYKEEGGFPAVFGIDASLRRQLHREYFNALLLRDVIERYNVRYPQVLRHLANRVINGIGTLFSVRKVHDELKSLGYSLGRDTITQFLQWMEDAYFIFAVPAFSASVARQAREFRKLYCVDHSMAASLSTRILKNRGQMLENMVFCALRQETPGVYYYRTGEGYEVDFIALLPDGEKVLVQVCEDMSIPETRSREIRALTSAMAETKLTVGYIVTESLSEIIGTPAGTIRCVPAPEFFMQHLTAEQ